ncbi:Trna-dihydrouridine synthase, partial [Globisporangium splendens]
MSFWSKLAKPIYCVAPMANVTDVAFRRIITDLAKPTVMWTEFVSCEALTYDAASRKRMMATLMYAEQERPVVAQLFGSKPDQFYEKIIRECKRGAGDIPVSVKTRIGFHEIDYKDWVLRLLGTEPEVLTIHGRTRDEMSKVPAHWDAIGDIVSLSKSIGSSAFILGNGDVKNLVEAKQKVDEYGVDGVMLGRALFGNPWLFQGHLDTSHIPVKEKLEVIRQHTKYFETLLAEPKLVGFPRMKKFYGAYLKGMPNARQVRDKFALARTAEDVYQILDDCLAYLEAHEQEELQQHDEARMEAQ